MLPYKSIIKIDRKARAPLYLQISNAFIKNISSGTIASGLKLPGSRILSDLLKVNRRTIITAYEELEAQGWIRIKANQGTFISTKLPLIEKQLLRSDDKRTPKKQSSFELNSKLDFLDYYDPPDMGNIRYTFNTGYPDVRLAPLRELTHNLNGILRSKTLSRIMNYSTSFNGDVQLRLELVKYLAETRSIQTTIDNIIIVRGSLMAFFNIFQVLLSPGDKVIVGDVSFKVANNIIKIAGGNLIKVPIDQYGIDVDAIEKICKRQKIRAAFVMPHHHHPTTVSLSAERRMKLLMLAEKYGFAIIEDDYDYDFHYSSSPILPMASADKAGTVIYVGSFSKTVAPGLRTGFVVAPENLIRDLSRLSRFIDCHGNTALERAIAMLFKDGLIRRHLKKSLKAYRERRDFFCKLLKEELGDFVEFDIPDGGLAVWVKFNRSIPVKVLRPTAQQKGLLISDPVFYDWEGKNLNAIRMGFASLNNEELGDAVKLLKEATLKIKK